ncbi:MAG: hypothetical protein M3Z21_08045 [Pseudomonadota bacterium]|nr:hypothetical protein [Pseudomonadota bacterium]
MIIKQNFSIKKLTVIVLSLLLAMASRLIPQPDQAAQLQNEPLPLPDSQAHLMYDSVPLAPSPATAVALDGQGIDILTPLVAPPEPPGATPASSLPVAARMPVLIPDFPSGP